MKLIKAKLLSDFRGLSKNFSIDFEPHQKDAGSVEPICLVGLNGSGKSNVLEVLSEIFYYLETYHLSDLKSLPEFKTGFGFEIIYSIPRDTYEMARVDWPELSEALGNAKGNIVFEIIKKAEEYPVITARTNKGTITCTNKDNNRNIGVLPSRIIGYSSGMNELISNPFIKIDFHYIDAFEKLAGESELSRLDVNRMFFMDYDSNKLVTIANFLFDQESFDRKEFYLNTDLQDFGAKDLSHLKKEIGISKLDSFSISLRLRNNNNKPLELPSELNLAIEKLKKCATCYDEQERKTSKGVFRVIDLYFWVNGATQEAFRHHFKSASELYRSLYLLRLLNNYLVGTQLRSQIKKSKSGINISSQLPKHETENLVFAIQDIAFSKPKQNRPIFYRQLSDGEHQLLHVVGTIMLMDVPGTLFILDEPETHFNPEWRSQFISLLNKCLSDSKRDQEYILTSHSPFIVSDCKKNNVFCFSRNIKGKVEYKPAGFNTFGASVDIITKEIFNKTDTISELGKEKIEEIRSMPLNTLKEISNAKEASRVLGESVEKVLLFRELILKENALKKK